MSKTLLLIEEKKDWLTSFVIKSYFQIRDIFLTNLS